MSWPATLHSQWANTMLCIRRLRLVCAGEWCIVGGALLHCGPARVWMARVEKSASNETNSRTSTFLGNERTCPSDVVPHKICVALLRWQRLTFRSRVSAQTRDALPREDSWTVVCSLEVSVAQYWAWGDPQSAGIVKGCRTVQQMRRMDRWKSSILKWPCFQHGGIIQVPRGKTPQPCPR